jgi:hypothetical protein
MIEETPKRAPGVGQARFLVRGSNYLSLARARVLRPFYDEYPERVALDVGFPQPGRRGPSVAPKATGGVGASAGGAGGAVILPSSLYPTARPRDGGDNLPVSGSLPSPVSPEASSTRACAGEGGTVISLGATTVAGTTDVVVSQPINRPFVLRHVMVKNDLTAVVAWSMRIKLADDADTSGGVATSGVVLQDYSPSLTIFSGLTGFFELFPNKIVSATPKFIKVVLVNGDVANHLWQAFFSIEYLD